MPHIPVQYDNPTSQSCTTILHPSAVRQPYIANRRDRRQCTFFDVRVFNPLAPSNRRLTLPQCFRSHERQKRRAYEQRVREVVHSSFTPLVFAATDGMEKAAANVTYARIASLIAAKRRQPYSQVVRWLRCVLGFPRLNWLSVRAGLLSN